MRCANRVLVVCRARKTAEAVADAVAGAAMGWAAWAVAVRCVALAADIGELPGGESTWQSRERQSRVTLHRQQDVCRRS